jgi:putative lipoprotein
VGSLAVVLIAALAYAVTSFAGPNLGLAGTHWTVTQINGQPPVAGDAVVDLSFQPDQQIGGHAGCNSFGGKYETQGRALSFSEMISTMMACADDALNAQESAYLQALGSVASYDLAGDTLTLKDAGGVAVLVFARA